jgi:hypothetical protein
MVLRSRRASGERSPWRMKKRLVSAGPSTKAIAPRRGQLHPLPVHSRFIVGEKPRQGRDRASSFDALCAGPRVAWVWGTRRRKHTPPLGGGQRRSPEEGFARGLAV